jgi:hypothetical protein
LRRTGLKENSGSEIEARARDAMACCARGRWERIPRGIPGLAAQKTEARGHADCCARFTNRSQNQDEPERTGGNRLNQGTGPRIKIEGRRRNRAQPATCGHRESRRRDSAWRDAAREAGPKRRQLRALGRRRRKPRERTLGRRDVMSERKTVSKNKNRGECGAGCLPRAK